MGNSDDRTVLRKAVDSLIAEGIIKQDKDLQQIFNLSKSTISAYLNNPKPGKRFVVEFEKKFGISLQKFEKKENTLNIEILSRYIIETHAMLSVLLARSMDAESLKDVERVTNQLLDREKQKNGARK